VRVKADGFKKDDWVQYIAVKEKKANEELSYCNAFQRKL